MSKQPIKENEFFPAPGGSGGTVNYQTPYGTPSSPDISQDPGHFANKNTDKSLGGSGNTAKNARSGSIEGSLDALYARKDTPTPDEVVSGIKYELGQQIKKDKFKAKRTVLDNLKKDPHYYGKLKMLNIDDKSMVDNMTENKQQHPNDAPAKPKVTPNIEETKKIFAEMIKGKDKKYVVNSQICDVMKEMWAEKQARRLQ
jgi:hypothetical protein